LQQDTDFDGADEKAQDEHEKARDASAGATTGPYYEDWKNRMMEDDLAAARELEDGLVRGQNIPGRDPEANFHDQDESNVKKRDDFLKDLLRQRDAALAKE